MVDVTPKNIIDPGFAPGERPAGQLKYPLDSDSLKALSAALDILLPDKLFDITFRKQLDIPVIMGTFAVTADGTGTASQTSGTIELKTDATSGHTVRAVKDTDQDFLTFLRRSNIRFSFGVSCANPLTVAQAFNGYIVIGSHDSVYYGIKFSRVTTGSLPLINLYGVAFDGTTESSILIEQVDFVDNANIDITAKYTTNKIEFDLFQGQKIVTLTGNMPYNGATFQNSTFLDAFIKTSSANFAQLDIGFFQVKQDIYPA